MSRVALLVLVALPWTAAAESSFTLIGDFPGAAIFSRAYGISTDGSFVVGFGTPSGGNREAYVWDEANGMLSLGAFPGGSNTIDANDVSDDGSIVVGRGFKPAPTFNEAFVWDSMNGIQMLVNLPGELDSSARAVSADGSTIAGVSGGEAVVWTSTTVIQPLGDLPGGADQSEANGISDDGAIVVGSSESGTGLEAFIWDTINGMSGLGDLPGGNIESSALAVSGDGSTAVGWASSALANVEAFVWDSTNGMQGLGLLSGGLSSRALAASGDGSVVVGYGYVPSPFAGEGGLLRPAAFIWDLDNGIRPLQELLTDLGVVVTSGYHLEEAQAISADGKTIAGSAINSSGHVVSFVARVETLAPVPAPGMSGPGLAMLAISFAAVGLLVLRERSARAIERESPL